MVGLPPGVRACAMGIAGSTDVPTVLATYPCRPRRWAGRIQDGASRYHDSTSSRRPAPEPLGIRYARRFILQCFQVFAAPVALVTDAISYLVSMTSLLTIRTREASPSVATDRHVWREIGEGLRFVLASHLMRSLAGCTGTANFFSGLTGAVYVLYFIHGLHFRGALVGVVYGLGAVGGLVGAVFAVPLTQRLGLGGTLVAAILESALLKLMVPLAPSRSPVSLVLLAVSAMATSFGAVVYNINQVSLRQALTPGRLLGRMNASVRFLIWGTLPLGALAGGFVGSRWGLHATMWIGALGGITSVLWLLLSPVKSLREAPPAWEEQATTLGRE